MTSRESVTTRASASLKVILCLLSDPSCLISRTTDEMQPRSLMKGKASGNGSSKCSTIEM